MVIEKVFLNLKTFSMKKLFFLSLQIVVLITVIFSCSDKVVQEPTYSPPSSPANPPVTPPPVATPSTDSILRVYAGIDQLIFLPMETNFTANAYDFIKYKTDLTYEWKKIKGPDKYKMDDSTKASPILSNLEMGLYEFAFTATTPDARFETDTVNIQVAQPLGEFIMQKILWNGPDPFGGAVLYMPIRISKDKPVRIYIKPEALIHNWIEVAKVYPISPPYPLFNYIIDDDILMIYTSFEDEDHLGGYWELKLVFQ